MKPNEMRELLDREPFQPFRIRLTDGRSYDIRNPEFNMVAETVFIIGLPARDDPNPRFADTTAWIPWKLIAGIDPLLEPVTPAVS